jgi:transcriptional regulator with XRE-family HTH domain
MTFGQIIKQCRKKAGLTQSQLAEKLGVSYVNISQIENGHRIPKPDTVVKIANALGLAPLELLKASPAQEAAALYEAAYAERFGPRDADEGREPEPPCTDEEWAALAQAQAEFHAQRPPVEVPGFLELKERAEKAKECEDRLIKILDSLPVSKYGAALALLERACSDIVFDGENPLNLFRFGGEPYFADAPKMSVERRQYFITAHAANLTYAEIKEVYDFMRFVVHESTTNVTSAAGAGGEAQGMATALFEAAFGDIALHSPEKAGAKPPAP